MVEEVFFRVEAGFFQLSARSPAVPQDLQGKMSSGMSSWKNPATSPNFEKWWDTRSTKQSVWRIFHWGKWWLSNGLNELIGNMVIDLEATAIRQTWVGVPEILTDSSDPIGK